MKARFLCLITISFLLLGLIIPPGINAEDAVEDASNDNVEESVSAGIVSRQSWGADDSLLLEVEADYAEPKRVVYISLDLSSTGKTPNETVKDLYYFFTFKIGLGDMPFHFIQDDKGKVFEVNSAGSDAVVQLEGYESGDVLVGYIGKSKDTENPTPEYISDFSAGLKKILTQTKTSPAKVSSKNLTLSIDTEEGVSEVGLTNAVEESSFETFLETAKSEVLEDFKIVPREYSVELVEVDYPDNPEPGKIVNANLKIKNNGKDAIYLGSDGEIFVATDAEFDHESVYFSNGKWATNSRFALMKEGKSVLRVGEEATFAFEIQIPLTKGKISDDFTLIKKNGDKYEETGFKIEFTLDLGDRKILEVTETETGFLRVRSQPGISGEEVDRVLSGEKFEYIERSETGWYQIKLPEGKTGWVSGIYVKVIN